PRSALRHFTDPHEYQAAILSADVDVVLTQTGEFCSELTQIHLDRLRMQKGCTSIPLIEHTVIDRSRSPIFFLAATAKARIHHGGTELLPGEIMFTSPAAESHICFSTPSRWAAASLTPSDLAAAGRALTGRELVAPRASHKLRPPPH